MRRSQLEFQCDNARIPVQCGNTSKFCTYDFEVCDGIANCPGAEDEAFEKCRDKFSPLASLECLKKDIHNVEMKIRAVPCDGIVECHDESDEKNCSLPDDVLMYTLFGIAFISCVFSIAFWKQAAKNLKPIEPNLIITQDDFDNFHGTNTMKIKLQQMQSYQNSKEINASFVQMEIQHHSGVCSETVACIKVLIIRID